MGRVSNGTWRGGGVTLKVAHLTFSGHDIPVQISNSFSYLFGPIVAFIGVGAMVLVLRWAYAKGTSVVAAPAKAGNIDDYGLLVCVASPSDYIQGEIARRTLEDGGIRANLAQTLEGPKIMVWPHDVDHARKLLRDRK